MGKQPRIRWIDLLRAGAILCVVLCHAATGVYSLTTDYVLTLSLQSKIFCFASFSLGRLGVPWFLMISGSLLLPRKYGADTIKRFWKRSWTHLIICTVFWFVVCELFMVYYMHTPLTPLQTAESILFINSSNMSHLWYMPMILGMYILVPFVAEVLRRFDDRLFFFPVVVFSLNTFGFALLEVINNVYYPELPLHRQFANGFSGGWQGLYLVYGYFIWKGALKRIRTGWMALITAAAFVGSVYVQMWSFYRGVAYSLWYDNLLIMLTAVGVFELVSRIQHIRFYGLVKTISNYSFAVYLTHNIVRYLFVKLITDLNFKKPAQVLILWSVSFVGGLLVSFAISKIPKFGKYILYMK